MSKAKELATYTDLILARLQLFLPEPCHIHLRKPPYPLPQLGAQPPCFLRLGFELLGQPLVVAAGAHGGEGARIEHRDLLDGGGEVGYSVLDCGDLILDRWSACFDEWH